MTNSNEILSLSDIKYNFLINSTLDVIGELDLDGTINFISPQVHDILGYHPDEMMGASFINITHPDDVPGGKISIHSKFDEKSLVLSINDTGIGLDESEIIQLFKPFGKIERYGKGWDIVIGGYGYGIIHIKRDHRVARWQNLGRIRREK